MNLIDTSLFCFSIISSVITIMNFCQDSRGFRWGRFIALCVSAFAILYFGHFPWFRITIIIADGIALMVHSASTQTGRFHWGRFLAILTSTAILLVFILLGPVLWKASQTSDDIMLSIVFVVIGTLVEIIICICEKNLPSIVFSFFIAYPIIGFIGSFILNKPLLVDGAVLMVLIWLVVTSIFDFIKP